MELEKNNANDSISKDNGMKDHLENESVGRSNDYYFWRPKKWK